MIANSASGVKNRTKLFPKKPYRDILYKTIMSLDFIQVAAQIEDMAAQLKAREQEREDRLRYALETLHEKAHDVEALKEKIARSRSKITWLVAGLREGLDQGFKPSPIPDEFLVLASDGSHIDVDRHSPARCYLVNIGNVILRYGDEPNAILESCATLYAGEQDLRLADPLSSRAEPMDRALLAVKRATEECRALANLVEEIPPELPALALLDGSLVLWSLQAHPDFVKEELLNKGFLEALDRIREAGQERSLALASYISLSRSTEVVNALRVAICPHDPVDCDRYCPGRDSARDCDAVAGTEDRNLFGTLLQDGERGPVFTSLSSIVRNYYREHEVHFFYLKVADEIARVEFPKWVLDRGLVDLVHALALDQCQRGQGYPVALSEAHEKAVISGTEREQFQQLVELALSERGLPTTT